jgi:uncharacterized protein
VSDATRQGTMTRKRWEIRRPGEPYPIRGDVRLLAGPEPRSAVIICHGFKGFREWAFFPSLARAVARRGHAAISFDFTRNGLGDDGVDFSALDRFSENTHTRNVEEIRIVIEAVAGGWLLDTPPDRIALLGHSRGGAEAILAASERSEVDALVTWSAVATLGTRWSADDVRTWEAGGTVMVANARTKQQMPMGPGYWADVVRNRARLDVLAHAARLRIPWLIAHGESDETVPLDDAKRLFAAAGPNAELCLIEGATHTFGAAHPYAGPTAELQTVAQTTLSWLDRHLG